MRKRLSGKEIKQLNKQIKQFRVALNKKDKVMLLDKIIIIDNEPTFFYHNEQIIPTLKQIMKNPCLPEVTIDMPAVKFIVGGADVMRPGITAIDEFNQGDLIVIVDETHQKSLAIGKAKFSSQEMQKMQKGKVVENLHWVGDEIWKINLK